MKFILIYIFIRLIDINYIFEKLKNKTMKLKNILNYIGLLLFFIFSLLVLLKGYEFFCVYYFFVINFCYFLFSKVMINKKKEIHSKFMKQYLIGLYIYY